MGRSETGLDVSKMGRYRESLGRWFKSARRYQIRKAFQLVMIRYAGWLCEMCGRSADIWGRVPTAKVVTPTRRGAVASGRTVTRNAHASSPGGWQCPAVSTLR